MVLFDATGSSCSRLAVAPPAYAGGSPIRELALILASERKLRRNSARRKPHADAAASPRLRGGLFRGLTMRGLLENRRLTPAARQAPTPLSLQAP